MVTVRTTSSQHLAMAAAAALAAIAVASWSIAAAQDDGADEVEPARATEIRGGTCDAPGDVTALLESPSRPSAASQSPTVATSVTDVLKPFAELVVAPSVIVANAEGLEPTCGALDPGAVAERGTAVPLAGADGQLHGLAWLQELGLDATRVTVFLFAEESDIEVDPSVPTLDPAGSPIPAPGGSPIPAPGGSPIPDPSGSPLPAPSGSPQPDPSGSPLPDPSGSPAASPAGEDGILPGEGIDPSDDVDEDVDA
jgi:hypothetical protein